MINLILFALNILPIPPLDGFGVIEGLVPVGVRVRLQKFRALGAGIFLLLVLTKAMSYILIPATIGAALLNILAAAAAKMG